MKKRYINNLILLIIALIWGAAFVAQSAGMDYIGPFTFNSARSILGGIVLIPVIYVLDKKRKEKISQGKEVIQNKKTLIIGGICCGFFLMLGSSLQQIGIQYTTAGKAGFITALYILIVPILGLAVGKKAGWLSFGGWINAIIPVLIVPYYSVIGGWVIKYFVEYLKGNGAKLAEDGYFSNFISNGLSTEICFIVFCMFTLIIIYAGVRNGIDRVSKFMMPILVVLSVIIAIYSVTRPGALAGVKYFLVPYPKYFSWMTVVTAMGQMFYSLSIAMGILVTFGSYMKKDVSIEESTENVEVFDTAIAVMAGLMIIPAVFSFSGGDPDTLPAGPALMFITIPKVFASMGMGTAVGVLFFVLVLFAALTSSIALTESAVSTFEDELGWDRTRSTVLIGAIMVALGSLSALGYGPLAGVTVFGMQFLDFFDFLTNSVMMPIAALATCILILKVVGFKRMDAEIEQSSDFKRKKLYHFFLKYLASACVIIILLSSIANVLGWISM